MKIIEASGARIPAIGFGTWRLSGESCATMVARAIEVGYRHIDTARAYGNEREVGEGIRASGIDRGELFVTTKIRREDIGRGTLVPSAREAIDALAIGPADLLLIHWPNAEVPLEDSIDALNEARTEGLTRHIGVSNFPSTMFDDAAAMSGAPIVCNQVEYHPGLSQEAVLSACERNDAALVAYSPLGQGGELLRHPAIEGIARAHGKTPAQIVLRWGIEQPRVAVIPRSSNAERAAENFAILDFELTEADRETLDAMTKGRKRLIDPSFAPNWDRL